MKSVKGTQTEKNLMAAFSGESQARNRYTFFASAAKKEGLVQIATIFEETANQEKEHAKRLFSLMDGGEIAISGTYPAGPVGSTEQNLLEAAGGENYEWQHMYPDFAKVARSEGFDAIATIFESIAVAEKQHAKRYERLRAAILNGSVFKKETATLWRCLNCGYLMEALEAPKMCPACAHPQAYFELLGENW
ncbi:MAG: rubrerythrin [Spirochaetes bacterium GWD1_61_31]|nr:MAG: rubrerythrin [Spirochaetes bacterium GWB1_60_80]OHD35218.1 MAG: rubrerythrin [Spirochaetes bacterium GWC1_61_12]OHD41786.1 MAG: rubrerythrin [Spirochaetes bacterium GWD1_61_31]OHD42591.1 MAG: rubrerythrin [Spirochaetes bacterium GWE1_60_18]OHD59821.1 MAG: rubrerythrin [Spirochaetes bacterium GWF1_60_12]HAP44162.1 rubrerythrin family protein [Spirochaetaceae bacterium]